MKSYPSIAKDVRNDLYIYAFDKMDGSNIRAEWNPKKGFYKFGTRTQLIDSGSQFGKAINLIKNKYEEELSIICQKQKWESAIFFFEFYGPSSFAGSHINNEQQTVVLFDVAPYKHGLLKPQDFIKYFGHLDIAQLLYEGYADRDLINKIKNNALSGMTFEGCVCKGNDCDKLIMFKIKSKAWLDKLKKYCKDDEILYKKLA